MSMTNILRMALSMAPLAMFAWFGTGTAGAQDYPTRPVTIVVPFNAGGAADATGRILAEALSARLGQNVLVENVGGAGGGVGTMQVKTAQADGYMVGLGHMGTLAAAVPLNPDLKYDPREDFDYLGLVTTSPNVVYVRSDHPARTLQQFIQIARDEGAPIMGHGGIGAASHVACVMLFERIGVASELVPYKGFGQTISDVVGGHIDGGCDLLASVAPQAEAGTIRVLAIADEKRSPALPDVPTTIEAGLPEFQSSTWTGLFVPKGTPDAIVDSLRRNLAESLSDPVVVGRLSDLGASVPPPGEQGGEAMSKLVRNEIEAYGTFLKPSEQ